MPVSSKMIQIFPVKITGSGTDGECQSLDVHRQAQRRLAVSSDAVLPACQGRQAAGSSRAYPSPPVLER